MKPGRRTRRGFAALCGLFLLMYLFLVALSHYFTNWNSQVVGVIGGLLLGGALIAGRSAFSRGGSR